MRSAKDVKGGCSTMAGLPVRTRAPRLDDELRQHGGRRRRSEKPTRRTPPFISTKAATSSTTSPTIRIRRKSGTPRRRRMAGAGASRCLPPKGPLDRAAGRAVRREGRPVHPRAARPRCATTSRCERRLPSIATPTSGIYALGEGIGGDMVDYGWIERCEERRRVWEMTYRATEHAGGAKKNRRFDGSDQIAGRQLRAALRNGWLPLVQRLERRATRRSGGVGHHASTGPNRGLLGSNGSGLRFARADRERAETRSLRRIQRTSPLRLPVARRSAGASGPCRAVPPEAPSSRRPRS